MKCPLLSFLQLGGCPLLPVFGTQCRVIFRLQALVCVQRVARFAQPSARLSTSFMIGGVICLRARLSWGGQVHFFVPDIPSILTFIRTINSPGVCVGDRVLGSLSPQIVLPSISLVRL